METEDKAAAQTLQTLQTAQAPQTAQTAQITCFSVSQSQKMLLLGSDEGFRIFETQSFLQSVLPEPVIAREGGNFYLFPQVLRCAAMLYDTLIVALVAQQSVTGGNSSIVHIYDAKYSKKLAEHDFHQEIEKLKYMREILLVCSKERILLFDLKEEKPLKYILNCEEPKHLAALNDKYDHLYLVFVHQELSSATPLSEASSSSQQEQQQATAEEASANDGVFAILNVRGNTPLYINTRNDTAAIYASPALSATEKGKGAVQTSKERGRVRHLALNYSGTLVAAVVENNAFVKVYECQNGSIYETLVLQSDEQVRAMIFCREQNEGQLCLIAENTENQYFLLVFDLQNELTQEATHTVELLFATREDRNFILSVFSSACEEHILILSDDTFGMTVEIGDSAIKKEAHQFF